MALEDWMPTLAANLETVEGLEAVFWAHPDDEEASLPGALIAPFPCLVITPRNGDQAWSASGNNIALHRLQITLFVTEQILTEGNNKATPFIKLIRDKLASSITLGGRVDHVGPDTEAHFYEGPGGVKYAGMDYTGIIFRIEVKEHETFTVGA